jgi:hypothetical protein
VRIELLLAPGSGIAQLGHLHLGVPPNPRKIILKERPRLSSPRLSQHHKM